jgi:hypothetical protein
MVCVTKTPSGEVILWRLLGALVLTAAIDWLISPTLASHSRMFDFWFLITWTVASSMARFMFTVVQGVRGMMKRRA